MKKKCNRILACALTLIVIFSCFCTTAFAATAETVKQYGTEGGYLAIGDSISRGCGATGFYINNDEYEGGQYDMLHLRNVEGAFPYLIAQAVGCNTPPDMTDQSATYWPLCYPGMTVAMAMDIMGIDDGFTDEKLDYPYYGDMLKYFGYEGSFDGVRAGETYVAGESGQCGNVIELAGRADLITVQLGLCDVFYRAYRIATSGGSLAGGVSLDLSSLDAIAELVSTAIKEIKFGFEYWKANYPVLIERLKELNPDATIVMVGSFNLFTDLTLLDETVLPIGSLVNVITASMNNCYREWAKKYNVLYADISNTETLSTEENWALLGDFLDNTFTGTHPGQNGYDYITRQVLQQLPEKTENKNIVVDLGRFDRVDYVLVNGIPVKNYTMDGFSLTIPYSGVLANCLTVGIKGEDGKIAVQTYRLVYRFGEGYSAYRLYANNDAVGTALKPTRNVIDLIRSVFQRLIDGIRNLF